MRRISFFLGSIVFLLTLTAVAQENRSEISVQGTGLFTQSSSGNGTTHSATETGGLLATYRYHLNHWLSVEGAYGYDLNSQKYLSSSSAFRIQSRMNQMTGSLVLRLPSRAEFAVQPVLAGWWRSLAIRSDRQSDRYGIWSAVTNERRIRLRCWLQLCHSQADLAASGISRSGLRYAGLRILGTPDQLHHAHSPAFGRDCVSVLARIEAHIETQSSFFSGSFGSGFSMGLRGSIWSRMAASYTKLATITEICFRSSGCRRSYTSMLE